MGTASGLTSSSNGPSSLSPSLPSAGPRCARGHSVATNRCRQTCVCESVLTYPGDCSRDTKLKRTCGPWLGFPCPSIDAAKNNPPPRLTKIALVDTLKQALLRTTSKRRNRWGNGPWQSLSIASSEGPLTTQFPLSGLTGVANQPGDSTAQGRYTTQHSPIVFVVLFVSAPLQQYASSGSAHNGSQERAHSQ